jgi:hypothetical protein
VESPDGSENAENKDNLEHVLINLIRTCSSAGIAAMMIGPIAQWRVPAASASAISPAEDKVCEARETDAGNG